MWHLCLQYKGRGWRFISWYPNCKFVHFINGIVYCLHVTIVPFLHLGLSLCNVSPFSFGINYVLQTLYLPKTGILMLCLAMVDGDMSRIFCWVVKLWKSFIRLSLDHMVPVMESSVIRFCKSILPSISHFLMENLWLKLICACIPITFNSSKSNLTN